MTEFLAAVAFVALALLIVWRCNQPDPQVVKMTKERKQMHLRDESSARWDL